MPTKSGLPSWFPEDFSTDPELHAAFEDAAGWHAAAGKPANGKPRVHQHARTWGDLGALLEFSARTAQLEVTPAPRGKPGGPGLYDVKGQEHTPYFQNLVKALIEKRGMPPAKAYAIAYGALRKWAKGGGKVHGEVRAAAAGALAGEAAKVHGHAVTWDDVARRIDLASSGGHHVAGTDYEWKHEYIPLTHAAAASHGHGKVPKGWSAPGGGGKAAGPHHLKFTDASGKVSYHTVHDEGSADQFRKQAAARGMTAEEGDTAKDPGIEKMPKNARAFHDAAQQAGWNVSHYPGTSSDVEFDPKTGREIPGTGTPLHSVTAVNPVTGQQVRQSWSGNKVDTYNQKEPLQASIAAVKGSPVSPADLRDINTPAGRQRRLASRIASDGTEFSARGSGTNAQKVGHGMYQASQALSAGDRQAAIGHLRTAQSASVTGREVTAHGVGYASQVIAKHLKALGVQDQQYSVTWDDLDAVIEFAAAPAPAPAAAPAGSQSGGAPQARVPAGQAGGGQFGSGGGQPTAGKPAAGKPSAHQQHVAHVAHVAQVSTAKAALMATAADDRSKAAALIQQRNVLQKALASAGGKVSSGQAGAKTATTAKTKSTAPATAGTAAAPAASTTTAKAPAAAKTPAKAATTAAPGTAAAKATAAQLTQQIGALNTQINGLLAAAKQATAQAAALK